MMYIQKEIRKIGWCGIRGFTGSHFNVIEIVAEYKDNSKQISLRELQDIINERLVFRF